MPHSIESLDRVRLQTLSPSMPTQTRPLTVRGVVPQSQMLWLGPSQYFSQVYAHARHPVQHRLTTVHTPSECRTFAPPPNNYPVHTTRAGPNPTAEGPRDALCQSKSRQLLRSCRNNLNNKSTTDRSMELDHYDGLTRNKLCAFGYDGSTVVGMVNKLDRRRVRWQHDRLLVAKFSKSRLWDKVREGSTYPYFGVHKFPYNAA